MIFQATHKARSTATEAGGADMDPLRTNGYFLYAALEELCVLKELSRVKWRRQEEFGYNMLGLVFENSISKAVLDARPNPIIKVNQGWNVPNPDKSCTDQGPRGRASHEASCQEGQHQK
jgi:hypothetical protein